MLTLRRTLAEFLGTAFLLIAVVGSGIMAVKLSQGNDALALLANSLATGGALVALISAFAPISGAHFNPIVSLYECAAKRISLGVTLCYIAAQVAGAVTGVVIAHAMFSLPLIETSAHLRSTTGELIGEIVATLGLLLVIRGTAQSRPDAVPVTVAAYIVGAYWFTSSTSFANPAVTLARALTDTFAGIAPASVGGFIAAEFGGLAAALAIALVLDGPLSVRERPNAST